MTLAINPPPARQQTKDFGPVEPVVDEMHGAVVRRCSDDASGRLHDLADAWEQVGVVVASAKGPGKPSPQGFVYEARGGFMRNTVPAS